jgi:hypothetical protein
MKLITLPKDLSTVRWPIEGLGLPNERIYLTFPEMEAVLRGEPVASLKGATATEMEKVKEAAGLFLPTLQQMISPEGQAALARHYGIDLPAQ